MEIILYEDKKNGLVSLRFDAFRVIFSQVRFIKCEKTNRDIKTYEISINLQKQDEDPITFIVSKKQYIDFQEQMNEYKKKREF